ncbi:MAG: RusA family crossover junction endodeoxyribonuclease [Bifidobacterium tsurumiense]|uniref:RusA family crossover junction endodeoxyribonuclease n=1 Tax=Bifidobacterium tsurumiense TaxID=356829 RepID=UPI002A80F3F0|nr:RusA family crossover junction endodeoxyribonuclease [Bifidobacterium tsurumiense]MDY4677609.1 RusA family crossover junction endodeoxyribonuclease [Bifidobacterium tsurumiense]
MSMFELTIMGEPVPKGRPRVFKGHGVTPQRTRDAEKRIRQAFQAKYPNATPFNGQVSVTARFMLSHQGKPDLDNLFKLVTDALNGLAYADDSQIIHTVAFKIHPDRYMPRADGKGMRKRRTGDPLTLAGRPYKPQTQILISEIEGARQ